LSAAVNSMIDEVEVCKA